MITKKFSKSLHEEFDNKGREAAKKIFKQYGIDLKDNDNIYGVDLVAYKNGIICGYVEVEVRDFWKGQFNFETLNIPFRKKKFFIEYPDGWFIAFNSDCSKAFLANNLEILYSKVEEVKNKYVKNGELFFKVPIKNLKYLEI